MVKNWHTGCEITKADNITRARYFLDQGIKQRRKEPLYSQVTDEHGAVISILLALLLRELL